MANNFCLRKFTLELKLKNLKHSSLCIYKVLKKCEKNFELVSMIILLMTILVHQATGHFVVEKKEKQL